MRCWCFRCRRLLAGYRHIRTGMALAVLLVAAHVGFGYVRLLAPDAPPVRSLAVRIVQPSIDQAIKFDKSSRDEIFRTCSSSRPRRSRPIAPSPKLVVWPETSLPFLLTDRPDALVAIGDVLGDGQVLLVGNVRAEGQGKDALRYYNSVVAINDKGEIVDAVDKLHLVPGGEYFPFADFFRQIGLDRFVTMPTPFSSGTVRHPIAVADGLRAAIFICYEVIFPDEVRERGGGRRLHRQRHQRCLVRRYAGPLPAFPQRADPRCRHRPACGPLRPTTAFRRRSIRVAGSSMRSPSTCAAVWTSPSAFPHERRRCSAIPGATAISSWLCWPWSESA